MSNSNISIISIKLKPTHIEGFDSILGNLIKWLNRKKIEIKLLETDFNRIESNLGKSYLKYINCVEEKEFYQNADLLLSLGGDGTLIGSSQYISSSIPIFGINLGRLGFITEFQKDDFYDDLEHVIKGKFQIRKIPLHNVKITDRDGKSILNTHFLNDIVINKNDIARMFQLSLEADNQHIYNLSGDGIIISTPLGSTAYSLAAGGPIVHSDVKSFIITPICPHSLTYRPLILSDSCELKINLLNSKEATNLTVDGQLSYKFDYGQTVTIFKSNKKTISLIENNKRNYFQVLKEKFFHGR